MPAPNTAVRALVLAVAIAAAAVVALQWEVCRDTAFICEHTGSRKGHREWALGITSSHWYRKSPLEEFVAANRPGAVAHVWTRCARTGKNIFGWRLGSRHGSPGAMLHFAHEYQAAWIAHHSADEVLALYDLLLAGDKTAIEARMKEVFDEAR